jgi:hypothetical protein
VIGTGIALLMLIGLVADFAADVGG